MTLMCRHAVAWLLAGALVLPSPGFAEPPHVPNQQITAPANLADLAAFVDGAVAQEVASGEVASAVVTVVQDDRILFSRGYGFRDTTRTMPVDGLDTLVRPGSISKLYTWIALAQEIERGRVELDAPIGRYIDFDVPTIGDRPIRVRDLFSHSPGLSDVDDFIRRPPTLPEPHVGWLKAHVPTAAWESGTEVAHSNYGAAIAGYIVERVSDEPFANYTERHVLQPGRRPCDRIQFCRTDAGARLAFASQPT